MVLLSAADWNLLLNQLERLEASVGAQEALLRALTRQVGQHPTREQLEALTRDVAQMRAELKQAGKKRELSISPPSLRTALSVSIWLALILLATISDYPEIRHNQDYPEEKNIPKFQRESLKYKGLSAKTSG